MSMEVKHTVSVGKLTAESIQNWGKGSSEQARDPNRRTQHQVRAGRGLEAALTALQKGNVRIRFLQETKLNKGIHMIYSQAKNIYSLSRQK